MKFCKLGPRSMKPNLILSPQLPPAIRKVSGYSCLSKTMARLTQSMLVYSIRISQGSVATRFRYAGIFNDTFIANCSQSVPVKEFWKSIKIYRDMDRSLLACFIDSQCRSVYGYLATLYVLYSIMNLFVVPSSVAAARTLFVFVDYVLSLCLDS